MRLVACCPALFLHAQDGTAREFTSRRQGRSVLPAPTSASRLQRPRHSSQSAETQVPTLASNVSQMWHLWAQHHRDLLVPGPTWQSVSTLGIGKSWKQFAPSQGVLVCDFIASGRSDRELADRSHDFSDWFRGGHSTRPSWRGVAYAGFWPGKLFHPSALFVRACDGASARMRCRGLHHDFSGCEMSGI